jgi:hypothetical protein
MPEAVAVYLNSRSWQDCESTKDSLIATFQDDFHKYGKRVKHNHLFLDVGLMSTATGLNLLDFEKTEDDMRVNAGAICEEFIGQHLLFSQQPYCEPEVYYWLREKKNSSAEVDFVISEGALIVPIEVKAGKSGTLKSLHLFLREKHGSFGVRFNSDTPSVLESRTALPGRPNISYRLLSLPLYMVGQVRRLIRQDTDVVS